MHVKDRIYEIQDTITQLETAIIYTEVYRNRCEVPESVEMHSKAIEGYKKRIADLKIELSELMKL